MKLPVLLRDLSNGHEILGLAAAFWTTTGQMVRDKVENVANLWVGRALLGVGGDILFGNQHDARSYIVGLIAITDDRRLVACALGQCRIEDPRRLTRQEIGGAWINDCGTVTGEMIILNQHVDTLTFQWHNLDDVNNVSVEITGQQLSLRASFPVCSFIDDNWHHGKNVVALALDGPLVESPTSVTDPRIEGAGHLQSQAECPTCSMFNRSERTTCEWCGAQIPG